MDSVRKATSADSCGILACFSAAFEVYRDSYTAPAFADTILTPEMIERRFQEMTVFVRNCKRISLDTTAPLKRAIRFYERSGFSPSGKVQDFFGMALYEYVKTI